VNEWRRMGLVGIVVSIGEKRNFFGGLRNDEEKRSLGRHGGRWEDNIDVDCIELARDRYRWRELVTAVMNLRVP
jgi:hypothetical protein